MSVSGNSIGIDYHQQSVQISVLSAEGERLGTKSCENDIIAVIEYINRFGKVRGGAIEVSTGAAAFAEELRKQAGYDIRMCHPGYVSRMKSNPDKSDKTDGDLLADLHRVNYLPEVWLAPIELRDLRQLHQYRQQVVAEGVKSKNRLRAIFRQHRIQQPKGFNLATQKSKRWTQENLVLLAEHSRWCAENLLEQIIQCEQKLLRVLARLADYAKRDSLTQWLMTLKGVGIVTATMLRASIGTATRFKHSKQFSRFCGLSPRNASSGERQADSGLIRAGNPELKRLLLQVAHVLRRHDPYWIEFNERLKNNGKPACVIIAAIANRWMRQLFYRMREFETQTFSLAA